ncbi:flagellar biosynthesis protein FlhE [Salinisphaera dokdonensis CL-ES53]|uniref:Flagellar biosynthesis protein FlhE n=1 Tax=Salinisphaera dokdonensis CL-ES53 TaxID=1304272 RepID=A0ABV2AYC5_9GAMM
MGRSLAVLGAILLSASAGAMNTAHAAPGAWVAERIAPTLRQRDRVYETPALLPRATTPVTGHAITQVRWRHDYSVGATPLVARLCGAGRCVDASAARGHSDAFAGLPPRTAFRFRFRVEGRGVLAPVLHGAPLKLVVNFE